MDSNLIEQLVQFYKFETWHRTRLSDDEVRKYYQAVISKNRLITYNYGDKLIAYGEFWRINFEQFGRLVCGCSFSPVDQDVNSGPIAYVASVMVHPEYRSIGIIKYLRNEFFLKNLDAEYYVGEALRKKHQPIKVFKRSEFMSKYLGKEVIQSGINKAD